MVEVVARVRSRSSDARARAAVARKPRGAAPPYLVYVNRPLGGVVARWAFAAGVGPDAVTLAGAATAAAALALLVVLPADPWVSTVAGALLLVAYVLDSADGQLARLRGGGSLAGEWLDHVVDVAKTCAAHAAAAVVLFRTRPFGSDLVLAVPLVFSGVAVTAFFGFVLRDQLLAHGSRSAPPGSRLSRWVVGPVHDHATFCLVLATAGWPRVFAVAYTALAVASVVVVTRALRRSHAALVAARAPAEETT